jgi:hypothetical protein
MKFILTFILMISILLFVMFGSHLFLYVSLVRFFGVTTIKAKVIISVSLVLLGLSFLFASTFAHYWDTALTRGLYFAAGSWL